MKGNKFKAYDNWMEESNCTKIAIIMIPEQLQFEEKSL